MAESPRACKRGFTVGELIAWCGGASSLGTAARARRVGTVWHDSRKVTSGDVFVALKTEKDDGHRFVVSALKAGAVAAIVDKNALIECPANLRKRLIAVADPLTAVQRAATRYRRELGILMVGVTGSSGKTTARSFIAAVLRSTYPIGETYSNWNNHIGVPQSILRFDGTEWAGVIEMGANHAGEIRLLSRITRPDIGLITNIGYAHVGLFGSLLQTTLAKFEIADGLARDGFLLLNGDDPRLVAEAARRRVRTVYYGTSPRCDIQARDVRFDGTDGLRFLVDGQEFHLSVPGRHFLYSALPAIFLGRRCGIADERIAHTLASLRPVDMRGAVIEKKGVAFIVDCYNANPSSMKNAIVALGDLAGARKKTAVIGDMLELGPYARRLHRELGGLLARSGIEIIVAVGAWASAVAEGAIKAGMKPGTIETAPTADAALEIVRRRITPGSIVLLKASRGIHLETVFERF